MVNPSQGCPIMVTQEEVAKKAGVSFITVSRIINNKGNVKKETREKVLSVIKKLKYYPNSMGRALSLNRQGSIGIVAPVRTGTTIHEHTYYTEMMSGIETVCSESGFDMLISTQNTNKKDFDILRLYYERKVDGLIIFTPDLNDPQLSVISQEKIPCVIIGDRTDHLQISYVDSDNENGFYDITTALIKKGHSKIAFVKGPEFNRNAYDRYKGFEKAMRHNGLNINDDYLFNGRFDSDSGIKAMQYFMKLKKFPSAILCANDFMAFGVMSEAAKNKIQIPQDVSVAGFDGVYNVNFTNPSLSTVRQPILKMGKKATEMLLRMIQNGQYSFESLIFSVEYIENGTVDKVKG